MVNWCNDSITMSAIFHQLKPDAPSSVFSFLFAIWIITWGNQVIRERSLPKNFPDGFSLDLPKVVDISWNE